MRYVILTAALWLGTGPAIAQSLHALIHELEAAHHHHPDGDAEHKHHDAEHEDLLPSLAPVLMSAGPRLEASAGIGLAGLSPTLPQDGRHRATALDHGPPKAPPGRLASAVPSNRAPPA